MDSPHSVIIPQYDIMIVTDTYMCVSLITLLDKLSMNCVLFFIELSYSIHISDIWIFYNFMYWTFFIQISINIHGKMPSMKHPWNYFHRSSQGCAHSSRQCSDIIGTTTNSLNSTKISTPMKMLSLNCQLLYVTHTYVHI